jgi:hypothetical protein
MIWPSKWRHLKGLSDIMALAPVRGDDPGHYPTSPLFATEPAALSRSDTRTRRTHHLIVDEFHSFTTQSVQAFASMLSQSRKFGLYLCAAHQFWGQANQHLQEALQNTGIEVVFNVGRTVSIQPRS